MATEKTLPAIWLKGDNGAAAAGQTWIDGQTQKRIGAVFGVKNSTVNRSIVDFVHRWAPDQFKIDRLGRLTIPTYNDERKPVVAKAIRRWSF